MQIVRLHLLCDFLYFFLCSFQKFSRLFNGSTVFKIIFNNSKTTFRLSF